MRRLLAATAVAAVALASCSGGKGSSSSPSTAPLLQQSTTSTVPATPVVAQVLSPVKGAVQGSGGRGMVVVLTFTAKDPTALPAQFRLGGALPSPAPAAKAGHNPAFPGLVVGLNTTSVVVGGASANLANLFQIVSPAKQSDGSVTVTAVWTNSDPNFGVDTDATLLAFTVSGTAPDMIPASPTDMTVNSNPAQVTFHLSAADDTAASASSTTSTTAKGATSTTTTVKPGSSTTSSTTGASTTTTAKAPSTTTTVPATTTTTKLLGLF
ncbi:MAG TPA: hypothetical protein VHT97_14085 [Acidimicrobiales bacterium]|nr:hypothetical protein [Acidimicrobiales bacterium]